MAPIFGCLSYSRKCISRCAFRPSLSQVARRSPSVCAHNAPPLSYLQEDCLLLALPSAPLADIIMRCDVVTRAHIAASCTALLHALLGCEGVHLKLDVTSVNLVRYGWKLRLAWCSRFPGTGLGSNWVALSASTMHAAVHPDIYPTWWGMQVGRAAEGSCSWPAPGAARRRRSVSGADPTRGMGCSWGPVAPGRRRAGPAGTPPRARASPLSRCTAPHPRTGGWVAQMHGGKGSCRRAMHCAWVEK